MPRGGKREGAGRRKGSKGKRTVEQPEQNKVYAEVEMPLDYMLAVVRDRRADFKRRDQMAVAAAPYCHPRVGDKTTGKREEAQAAAEKSGAGMFAAPPPPKLVVDNR